MANLPEKSIWHEGIYQLEKKDKVLGGSKPDAVSNLQPEQLADRTLFLKQRIDEELSKLGRVPAGGNIGQILHKKTAGNYNTEWTNKPVRGAQFKHVTANVTAANLAAQGWILGDTLYPGTVARAIPAASGSGTQTLAAWYLYEITALNSNNVTVADRGDLRGPIGVTGATGATGATGYI
jgi:hypothetical protein